jgi:hypothetical protein
VTQDVECIFFELDPNVQHINTVWFYVSSSKHMKAPCKFAGHTQQAKLLAIGNNIKMTLTVLHALPQEAGLWVMARLQ